MAGTATLDILTARIRDALPPGLAVAEKKMFGGVGFLIDGNLLCCATRSGTILLRVGTEAEAEVLAEGGAQPFINGTRRMAGYVMLDADAVAENDALARRLLPGVAFTAGLPAKDMAAKDDTAPVKRQKKVKKPPVRPAR